MINFICWQKQNNANVNIVSNKREKRKTDLSRETRIKNPFDQYTTWLEQAGK